MTTDQRLEIVKRTRKTASDALYDALKKLFSTQKRISEASLRDAWLEEFGKHKAIFPEGWYIPPPHGFIILFGKDGDVRRTKFQTARPKEYWPRDDIFLDRKKGIALVYSSAVDKKSGIIGDFEMTFYLGKNKKVQRYIRTCFDIIKQTSDFAQPGMKISDVVKYCVKLIEKNELENDVYSIHDPLGVNIGHTIPFSNEDISKKDRSLLSEKSWEEACAMIGRQRVFMNSTQNALLKKGMAFTIEPRIKDPNNSSLPLVMFHTTMLFKENGEKELLTDFEKIFKLVGMDYMLDSF